MPINVGGYEIDSFEARQHQYDGIVRDGLVLQLDAGIFNTVTGTTWYDLSGNSNNGTLTNGPTFNSGNGGSIVFDGVDDYVSTSYFGTSNSSFTFSVWMRPNTSGGHFALGRGSDGMGDGWSVTLGTDSTRYRAGIVTTVPSVAGIQTFSSASYVQNQWVNLTGVWNAGNSISLYINSVFESSITTASTILRSSTEGWNMGRITTSIYSNTSVGLSMVYSRVLTVQEITQNYNVLKGRFGL